MYENIRVPAPPPRPPHVDSSSLEINESVIRLRFQKQVVHPFKALECQPYRPKGPLRGNDAPPTKLVLHVADATASSALYGGQPLLQLYKVMGLSNGR